MNPKTISCDFEKGAIKAFKFHFPGVKIIGCHFHFTSAIYKKVIELGLKTQYSGENVSKNFKEWVRMLMAFPFLMLEDIDEVWEEMKDAKPDLGDNDNVKMVKLIEYFENCWIKNNCHFDRSIWNLFDVKSSRTNNICETYNHKINGQVSKPNSNVFKILNVVQKEETLTSTSFERVNLGKQKKSTNAQQVKDAKIESLKLKYKHGELEVMDYLMEMSSFSAKYD